MGDVRKMREAVERLRAMADRLDERHRIAMTSKGRDPAKYSSTFSRESDEARAIPARGEAAQMADLSLPTLLKQTRDDALLEAWNAVWEAKTLLDAKNALHALIGERT